MWTSQILTGVRDAKPVIGRPGEAQLQDAQSLLEKYDKDTDIPLSLKTELKTILETKPRKKRKKADAIGATG